MRPHALCQNRLAFTLLEAVLLLLIAIVVVVVLLVASARGGSRNPGESTSILADEAQPAEHAELDRAAIDRAAVNRSADNLRAIQVALFTFAADNKGDYPIPSLLDRQDMTEPSTDGSGHEKNRTGAIFSIMLFQNLLAPEMLVDPAEANSSIRQATAAEVLTSQPPGSVDPQSAIWDPAFKGTPSTLDRANSFDPMNRMPDDVGFVSYAHAPPWGARFKRWSTDACLSTLTVVSNRGPKFEGDNDATPAAGWKLLDGPQGTGSLTLKIHGKPDRWEGNVAYNDGSVHFEQDASVKELIIQFNGDGRDLWADNICCAEPTPPPDFQLKGQLDPLRVNAYLRLFRVGPDPKEKDQTRTLTGGDAPWWDGLE